MNCLHDDETAPKTKGLGLHVVGKPQKKHTNSATTLNRHIKAAVIRLAFDSCLDISRFANIAKYAGIREDIALNVIREYVRDLRAGSPPSSPAGQIRRAA